MPDETIVNTSSGVLVGVEPAAPLPAPPVADETPAPTADPDARFTLADLEKAREQEKSKVYSKIDSLQSQVAELAAERAARLEAEAEAERQAAEAERARLEAQTDVRELLARKEQELQAQIESLRLEAESERAARAKEQEFFEFQQFKAQAIEGERENILPELIDYVDGDTPEEIASSIARLREKSEQIMNNTTAALADVRREQRTVSTTGLPLAGPLDNETANALPSPEQISGMSMSEWAKHRSQFGVGRSNTGRGLFS